MANAFPTNGTATITIGLANAVKSCRKFKKEIKKAWPKVHRGNRHERRKAAAMERKQES